MQNGHSVFLASLPSLALCLQPRSRPFVWLLPRDWIRKNTDCFAVYWKNENRINWYGWPNKITAGLNLFRSLIFDCNNFLQREPKRQLYFVMASLTKSCFEKKKRATALIDGGTKTKPTLGRMFHTLNKRCKLSDLTKYTSNASNLQERVVSNTYF